MSPWADTVAGRQLLCGLWLSDNNAKPSKVLPEIAFAKQSGAKAVYLHCDGEDQWQNVYDAAELVKQAGLVPVMGNHVTNGVRGEWRGVEGGLAGCTINVRTWGKNRDAMRDGIVEALARRQHVVFLFGWYDGGPGEAKSLDDRWPELAQYLRGFITRVTTPTLLPGDKPTVPPVPQTPTTPPKVPSRTWPKPKPLPPPQPKKKSWWDKLKDIFK
jgi:hypothetical protein